MQIKTNSKFLLITATSLAMLAILGLSIYFTDVKWTVLLFIPLFILYKDKVKQILMGVCFIGFLQIVLGVVFYKDISSIVFILIQWIFVYWIFKIFDSKSEESVNKRITHQKLEAHPTKNDLALNFNSILSELKIGVWSWDVESNEINWNDTMFDLFDLEKLNKALTFKDWENVFIENIQRERFNRLMFGVLLEGSEVDAVLDFKRERGDYSQLRVFGKMNLDESGKPVAFNGIVADVTLEEKLKKAQSAYILQLEKIIERRTGDIGELHRNLSQSEELFKSMSEIGAIGGWYLDLIEDSIQWSEQVYHIHGLPLGEIRPLEDLINFYAPEARGVVIQKMERCREYAEPFEFELPFITTKKKRIWVKSKAKPVLKDGKVIGISGIFQEVTSEKTLRENLVLINNELDAKVDHLSNELLVLEKEIKTLTETVSQDLRAPLRAIEGFSKAIQENYINILEEEGKRWLHYIVDNSVTMGVLISDILEFSSVSRAFIQPVEINVNELIERNFDELKLEYQKNSIKLNVEKLPKLNGDRILINLLFNNLLSNALKFSSKSEEIKIEITGRIENELTIYEIKDWGAGFDQKYADKLFVLFQKMHSSDEFAGSGVGLAIVERIIKKHKGWISAKSAEGQGTTFTFGIPIN
ncbi:MAG: PAS domain-containing protein [Bacteroidetes bacterium]|nr:PAS domain-containing protein [Bacteroidota bacterium]